MGAFLLAIVNFGLSIVQTIFRGYVLMVMWGWFVMTQFPGAPRIGVVGAIGLSCLWSLFTVRDLRYGEYKESSKLDSDERIAFSLVQTGIGLFVVAMSWLSGYIVHCFM